MRNRFKNRDTLKIIRTLEDETILGDQREKFMALIVATVYAAKGLDLEGFDPENFNV